MSYKLRQGVHVREQAMPPSNQDYVHSLACSCDHDTPYAPSIVVDKYTLPTSQPIDCCAVPPAASGFNLPMNPQPPTQRGPL